jgi:hypothetical protein
MMLAAKELARHYHDCQCKTCPECGTRAVRESGSPYTYECIQCGLRWHIRECGASQDENNRTSARLARDFLPRRHGSSS